MKSAKASEDLKVRSAGLLGATLPGELIGCAVLGASPGPHEPCLLRL